jgi:hypothetical protein
MIPRPDPSGHPAYFSRYVGLVPDGDVLLTLRSQLAGTLASMRGMDEEDGGYRYEPGKWSIRQVLGHVIDTERVMAYRALHFARGDAATLPSMDQDRFVAGAGSDARTLADLADELEHVRLATIALFRPLSAEALARRGIASGAECSVRALAWIIAGHELHHAAIIRERYLPGLASAAAAGAHA